MPLVNFCCCRRAISIHAIERFRTKFKYFIHISGMLQSSIKIYFHLLFCRAFEF